MNTSSAKSDAKKTVDDAAHSASADKAKGHTKQVVGNIKEKVGNFIGDDELAAKGTVQRADGKKDELKGNIKEKIEDAKDTLKAGVDVVKEKFQDTKRKA